MLEILQNFESTVGETAWLSPGVLVGLEAAVVGVGLFVWLGGLGLRKLLVAIGGAVAGGILGLVLIGSQVPTAASAVVGAIIARIFEKVFLAVLAAALAGSIGFAVLAGPYVENSAPANPAEPSDLSAGGSAGQSSTNMKELKAYTIEVGRNLKQAALKMPVLQWAIIALLALLFLVGGFTLWRLNVAMCFSVLGTILIFAGMILLLLYKGSEPVNRISGRPLFYVGVFAAMVVFGTFEQLLLCRDAKPRASSKGKTGTQKKGSQKKRKSWRTT